MKKKKKIKRKKARKTGSFKLTTRRSIGLMPWSGRGPLDRSHMVEITSHPSTVQLDIFKGTLRAPDHKLPRLATMEVSMQDAKALAEAILEAASDARTFALAWKTQ